MLIPAISVIIGVILIIQPNFLRLSQHSALVSKNQVVFMRIIGIVFIVLSVYGILPGLA